MARTITLSAGFIVLTLIFFGQASLRAEAEDQPHKLAARAMKLEHVALNVADPVAMAAWYEKHLGLRIVRKVEAAPHTHFLADSSGTIMLEIYHNPPGQVPHYAEMNPLVLHVAFVSDDPDADKKALLAAGATLVEEQHLDDGSHLVMMRDPWGLALQLCKRAKPMLRDQPAP